MAKPTKKQVAELQSVFAAAADDPSLPEDLRKKAKTAAKQFSAATPTGTAAAIDLAAIMDLITKFLPVLLQILSIFRNRGGSADPTPGPV